MTNFYLALAEWKGTRLGIWQEQQEAVFQRFDPSTLDQFSIAGQAVAVLQQSHKLLSVRIRLSLPQPISSVLKASGSSSESVKFVLRGVGRNYQHTPVFC